MNTHEKQAYDWLISKGAKSIEHKPDASPDFKTNIGLFEVKGTKGTTLYFTQKQINMFDAKETVTYLIYFKNNSEPFVLNTQQVIERFTIFNGDTRAAFSHKKKGFCVYGEIRLLIQEQIKSQTLKLKNV